MAPRSERAICAVGHEGNRRSRSRPGCVDIDAPAMMRIMFDREDFERLTNEVVAAWLVGSDRDWSAKAGTLDWTCRETADHAVDCTFAPAFMLASRKQHAYPDMGSVWSCGPEATPAQLVQALEVASRVLVAVVADAPFRHSCSHPATSSGGGRATGRLPGRVPP